MRKKLCAFATASAVVLFSFSAVAMSAEEVFNEFEKRSVSFSDTEEVSWAKEAIETLSKNGVISGFGDGTFRPYENITRMEFIKMAVLSLGLFDHAAESSYSDVPQDSWGYDYASSAKKAGMLSIYSEENLEADKPITREDMAYITKRALEYGNFTFSDKKAKTFSDEEKISDYAKDAVLFLSSQEIINGNGEGEFNPQGNATRAEAAKIIHIAAQKAAKGYYGEE